MIYGRLFDRTTVQSYMQTVMSDLFQGATKGDVELKEWKCVQVGHRKNIGKTIEEWQKNSWRLHTYTAMGMTHYLLFEKKSE